MTDTLIARIEARLTELEAAATAVNTGQWYPWDARNGELYLALHNMNAKAVAHITLNDPAAVLTLVAGLRDVIAAHPFYVGPMWGDLCTVCVDTPWPCPSLLALAAALGVEPDGGV